MSEAALEALRLGQSYDGRTWAVRNLDLTVRWGEIVGLLGPNGSGKTTTFHMLVGLLEPSEGRIRIGGHLLDASPREAKALLGFLPEYMYPLARLTGWEYVLLMAALHGLPREAVADRAEAFFDLFGLREARHREMETYSQGMLRKTFLIAALIHRPRVLIVDEPTNGLDAESFLLLKRILRRMREDGGAVLLATHQLALAQELCDRVYLLHRGTCFAAGAPSELLARYNAASLEEIFLREVVDRRTLERIDGLVGAE